MIEVFIEDSVVELVSKVKKYGNSYEKLLHDFFNYLENSVMNTGDSSELVANFNEVRGGLRFNVCYCMYCSL